MALIEFNEEQGMLMDTAAEFCRQKSPVETVRANLEAEAADRVLWQEMTELGWMAINIPEVHGGLGMGLASVIPVVENMGSNLMGTPYIASTMAAEALVSSGSEAQQAQWLPRMVEGAMGTLALVEENGSWLLDQIEATATRDAGNLAFSGDKYFVTDVDAADFLIASVALDGEARLVLIRRDQLPDSNIIREEVIDQTRRSFHLSLDGIVVPEDQLLESADFSRIEQGYLLCLTAECSGGLSSVLHLIVEYLNTRKAFNRYIGSYQSLKHPAADIVLSLEAARSHLYHAATEFANNSPDAEAAIMMAKALACEAYAFAGDRAVQFHGGFGFTFECDAQLYLRRALWCQYQFGDEIYQQHRLAPLLLDETG